MNGDCKLPPEMGRSHLGYVQGHWLKKKMMVGKMKEKTRKKEEEEKAPLEMTGFFCSLAANWTGIFFSSSGVCLELEPGSYWPVAKRVQLAAPPGTAESLPWSEAPSRRCAG